ncbi:hypothetical protein EVA_02491 [gut metagenome]|uniref:Uncharacterized protein n=1 Tax=gut metagenome TaxID=749906 RepID=J9H103_9ZZZZ
MLHPAYPLLLEAFWHQARDDDRHAGLGVPFRTLRFGRSRFRSLDVYPLHDCLWCSVRLLQYLWCPLR